MKTEKFKKVSFDASKSCEQLDKYIDEKDTEGWKTYRKTATIKAKKMPIAFKCDTLEGDDIRGKAGDYLAQGVKGELYPIDQKIFEQTYEEVVEEEE